MSIHFYFLNKIVSVHKNENLFHKTLYMYNRYLESLKAFCNNLQFFRRTRTFTQMTHVFNGVKKTVSVAKSLPTANI